MVATDHAPHTAEEKSKGLEKSLMGVVGIETAFPLLYTHLVRTGAITLEKLIELMSINPRRRFKLEEDAGFAVFDLEYEGVINPDEFISMGKSTPFAGAEVMGECLMTVLDGRIIYRNERMKQNAKA